MYRVEGDRQPRAMGACPVTGGLWSDVDKVAVPRALDRLFALLALVKEDC